jgi:uncharacterized Zn-binding protein involved in type VI secretion
MPTHVLVNGLGLTHKGSVGVSMATLPDVCKTPSPGGPVPIPYPNFAQHSSLSNGTTTVKVKGNIIAVKGSHYSRSNGDEAGTAGGVKSNVNMKATDWITYSFDVKMDGKNACRNTDKKFHNNQNTVDMQGNFDPVAALKTMQDTLCACVAAVQTQEATSPSVTCTEYGNRVHDCCDAALASEPGCDGERGYNNKTGERFTDSFGNPLNRGQAEAAGISFKGVSFPDACALDSNGDVAQFFDFKTTCPKGNLITDKDGNIKRDKYGRSMKASGDPLKSKSDAIINFNKGKNSQFKRYQKIGEKQNPKVQRDPQIVHAADCP